MLLWTLARKPTGDVWARKVVGEITYLKRPRFGAVLKEEVWESPNGKVVKYSLAYINPMICREDNGRVLGYDNSHGHHHRHFMGKQNLTEFSEYEALAERFYTEVRELWRKEDEERRKT